MIFRIVAALALAILPVSGTTKESYRDKSTPLFESTQNNQGDRDLVRCREDEEDFKFDLKTDNYGFENSWKLEVREDSKWTKIQSGPPDGFNYADKSHYIGVYCLPPGKYKITVFDLYKDGICCTYGEGQYFGAVHGSTQFSSSGSSDWAAQKHRFKILPPPPSPTIKRTTQPTKQPTKQRTTQPTTQPTTLKPTIKPTSLSPPTNKPSRNPTSEPNARPKPCNSCSLSERKVKVDILTDKYGEETSWIVRDRYGKTLAESELYVSNENCVTEVCLEDGGVYEFVVHDSSATEFAAAMAKAISRCILKNMTHGMKLLAVVPLRARL